MFLHSHTLARDLTRSYLLSCARFLAFLLSQFLMLASSASFALSNALMLAFLCSFSLFPALSCSRSPFPRSLLLFSFSLALAFLLALSPFLAFSLYWVCIFSPLSSWGGRVIEQLGGHLASSQGQSTTLTFWHSLSSSHVLSLSCFLTQFPSLSHILALSLSCACSLLISR